MLHVYSTCSMVVTKMGQNDRVCRSRDVDPNFVRIVAQQALCVPVRGIWTIDQCGGLPMVRVGVRVDQAGAPAGFNVRMTVALFKLSAFRSRGLSVNVFVNIDPDGIKLG